MKERMILTKRILVLAAVVSAVNPFRITQDAKDAITSLYTQQQEASAELRPFSQSLLRSVLAVDQTFDQVHELLANETAAPNSFVDLANRIFHFPLALDAEELYAQNNLMAECTVCYEQADIFTTPCGVQLCFSCYRHLSPNPTPTSRDKTIRCPKCRSDHASMFLMDAYYLKATSYPFEPEMRIPQLNALGTFSSLLAQAHTVHQALPDIIAQQAGPTLRQLYNELKDQIIQVGQFVHFAMVTNLSTLQNPSSVLSFVTMSTLFDVVKTTVDLLFYDAQSHELYFRQIRLFNERLSEAYFYVFKYLETTAQVLTETGLCQVPNME
jgi:hypothetical protein